MLGTYMSDCGVNVHKSGELKIPTMRLSKLVCDSVVRTLAGSTVVGSCERCEGGEHTTLGGRYGVMQPTISTRSTRGVSDSCNVIYRMHKVNHSLYGTTKYYFRWILLKIQQALKVVHTSILMNMWS